MNCNEVTSNAITTGIVGAVLPMLVGLLLGYGIIALWEWWRYR